MTRYEQLYAFLREHPASDAQTINRALGTSGKVIYYEIKKGMRSGEIQARKIAGRYRYSTRAGACFGCANPLTALFNRYLMTARRNSKAA
ncbi:hypothetical protein A9B99_15510 [Mangrovibacter phragmitis]|uniref:Uncharacterized protein n=1 Tax=Mangrovibacter phragmitis TaxID=1691903 RepID=A0A1B7KYP4_9ENTR|nr:hypothetical protein [Mangrovibacter phragmitis]OAT75282.1 hypothetical protein A9B99_15510 [Mangrovibacter phragmitis]